MENTTKQEYLSSTNLAKEMNIGTKKCLSYSLLRNNWIDRVNDEWVPT